MTENSINCPICNKKLIASGDFKDHYICSDCKEVWVRSEEND